ncbi:UNVERIFIED_CONTAM: hypothetical protein FKN15_065525 [Acipenser sinensis]
MKVKQNKLLKQMGRAPPSPPLLKAGPVCSVIDYHLLSVPLETIATALPVSSLDSQWDLLLVQTVQQHSRSAGSRQEQFVSFPGDRRAEIS